MRHPLLRNYYGIPIYICTWILFVLLLFIIGWYFDGNDLYSSFVNSISFSLPLFVLGACVWYVVRYVSMDESGILGFILHHLTAGVIVVGIWISVAYQIRIVFFGEDPDGINYFIPLHWQVFFALCIYDYIILVYYLIIYYRNFQEKTIQESELKNLVKEAELNALKSQINPHFLFNSLNSVSSLTLSSPEQSREMVVKLSTFLRYSLGQDLKELNSLSNELNNIRLYLDIEKVRFGERVVLKFNSTSDCDNLEIPNLILQPIYENAIKYGVHESIEPVTIRTNCEMIDDVLKITISNNFDPESIPPKGNGIGLRNIQERLSLIYGRTDLMKIVKSENQFTVNLEFPQNIQA
ncbi:histidine kinase [Marinifilum fragile]|uniref:sensor histidine kinase n=1 Tax=Marinifilum fragile TaxID=570161 RepID=UPI002AA6519A|nr:histidine kinase [Marinifilum fragile]